MELFIVRHAHASLCTIDETDRGRILSDEGLSQAVKVAKYLDLLDVRSDLILTSPFRRAVETAHLIAEFNNGIEIKEETWLSPGMNASTAITALQHYQAMSSLILVGHQPDLSELISSLDEKESVVKVALASLHHFSGYLMPRGGKIEHYTTY